MQSHQNEHRRARFGFRRIALVAILIVLVAVPAVGWQFIWRSPPYFTDTIPAIELPVPIMTNAEYGEIIDTHARPYVITIETESGGRVVLFGAEHTRDPSHPQLDRIRSEWEQLGPTVALVEGRLGFLIEGMMDPVANLGEGGLVKALAHADDVPVYNWDLSKEELTQMLLVDYPGEQVALLMVLNPYFGQVRFGKPENPEAFVEPYRAKRTQFPGLEGTLPTMEALEDMWRRDFPDGPDWRETSDEYGLPGYLQHISERARDCRDERLARLIVSLVSRGEKVFVIAGSSHAVRLEPALRALLEQHANLHGADSPGVLSDVRCCAMKTLLIMRHAKSSWKGTELSDFDRPLKKRGKHDAPKMGELIRDLNLTPALIISSSAKRAQSTAKRVASASGYAGDVRYTESLYLAPARGYISELNDLAAEDGDHQLSNVMVVGHNPGLEDLVYTLTGKAPAMPTAAIAVVDLDIASWDQLDESTRYPGTLRAIYLPREVASSDQAREDSV